MRFIAFTTVILTFFSAAVQSAPSYESLKKGDVIPGSYFVQLKPHQSSSKHAHTELERLRHILASFRTGQSAPRIVKEVTVGGYKTFAIETNEQVAEYLSNNHQIAAVHPNKVVSIDATQTGAPWGLVRISDRNPENDNAYDYPETAGEGIDVFVIDTGVMVDHPEFEGRARFGASFINGTEQDGHGHGTHVAGTIASKSFGVAKKANIVAVRVLDNRGSGTTLSVISGMEFVVNEAKKRGGKIVVNMSLGGTKDTVLDSAADAMIEAGAFLVVAAGNDNKDACGYSPAGASTVFTVGAMDSKDKRAIFSNTGKCVDIFAPGSRILSTWNNGKTSTLDGTSMASPHVAGITALLLGENAFSKPAEAWAYLKRTASLNRLTGIKGAFNGIAYNGYLAGSESNPPEAPAQVVCGVFSCMFKPECDVCKGLF